MYIINIALNIPLYQTFSYTHNAKLAHGQRVLIEFRNKKVIGFVWHNDIPKNELTHKLKPIITVYDEILPDQLIKLITFCSNYYHYPIGATLFSVIPQILKKNQEVLPNSYSLKNLLDNHNDNLNIIKPNAAQIAIISSIANTFNRYVPHLLYGVTGSGKTEVYLALIEKVLSLNKQILVLVPEINLTPQILKRFTVRFPNTTIFTLTSHTTVVKRYQSYIATMDGSCQIVIGTRLSIFTPFKNLGLIIVDEEHDQSFKQNDGLRYNARDLAVWRSKQENIPIILGSATPSLETLFKYKKGNYQLHKLTNRGVINAILPKIKLIDLSHKQNSESLTQEAIKAIKERLNKQELSLVFINRRGYAPLVTCAECDYVSNCKQCSTTLVYHNVTKNLQCHHCGYSTKIPTACPKCGSQYLRAIGDGTQKIEESLTTHFPEARILRIDQDTISGKHAWQKIYQQINNNEIDILVGTQMLAKGHDFHNLTLVVGLNIDNGLYSYDFRASELLFTQLTQVAGRAGRGDKPGLVLLQTRYPDHKLYQYLLNNDVSGFINHMLSIRKQLKLPPYSYYAIVKAQGRKIEQVLEYLTAVVKLIKRINITNITVYQPVPAILQRLKNKERGQILIQSTTRIELEILFDKLVPLLQKMKPKHSISWIIDIDPYEI